MFKRAEFRGIATGLSMVALSVLLAITVDLGVPGQQLLHTLRFHLAAVFLLLPLALLFGGAYRRALLVLVLVAASAGQGAFFVARQQVSRTALIGEPAATLQVVSFNVLAENSHGSEIADYLSALAPDLAVIMESQAIEPYLARLEKVLPNRIGCEPAAPCDLMVLSRLPLINGSIHQLGPFKRWRLIVAGIEAGGQRVTVVALHLSKPYFDDTAWMELFQVRSLLRSVTGPVILSGDFNAAAWSGNVNKFAFQAGLIPPPDYPPTWPVELGAFGVPIDNMFTRGNALIRNIAAIPDPMGSNHRGLRAIVDIAKP